MYDEEFERNDFRDVQRSRHLMHGGFARVAITHGRREAPLSASVGEHVRDWRVNRVQNDSCFGEPVFQRSNRGAVVIVEVTSRRKYLDGFKSAYRDVDQVRLLQPLFVIQVGRHSKFLHTYKKRGQTPFPFLHYGAEQLAQTGEPRIALEVHAHVIQRTWNVLDVHGIASRRRLMTERAERL